LFGTLTSDILESGSDDFESGEDIHDAVGSILTEVAGDEGEEDIIDICNQLMGALKGYVETSNVQFQKISILPPQKGLEFPGGWRVV